MLRQILKSNLLGAVALVAAAAALGLVCLPGPVDVRVVDGAGQPIPGAVARFRRQTKVADAEGRVRFAGRGCTQLLTIHHSSFHVRREIVAPFAGGEVRVEMQGLPVTADDVELARIDNAAVLIRRDERRHPFALYSAPCAQGCAARILSVMPDRIRVEINGRPKTVGVSRDVSEGTGGGEQ